MGHDVFISHSSEDKAVADAVTAKLEQAGYRCWIAPRDILPADSWSGSIVRAIEECTLMVIIFSQQSNASQQVVREVERAINSGATVIPMRIDETMPTDDLSYFLGSTHWMDAIGGAMESKLSELVDIVGRVMSKNSDTDKPEIRDQSVLMSAPQMPATSHKQAEQEQASSEEKPGSTVRRALVGIALLMLIGIGLFMLLPNLFSKFELGVYQSNWGRITFFNNNARAEYPSNDNGRLVGEFDKNLRTFSGYWIEDKADRGCGTALEGSIYWGRIEIKFERDFSQFNGNWSYCDEPLDPNRTWTGKR